MTLTVLGASGGVGTELTRQALDRGEEVVAICRHPDRIALPNSPRLTRVAADVLDTEAIARALDGRDTVLSALGTGDGEKPGVLTAGARAIVAAAPARVVSVGALGTGRSAKAAGWLTRTLLGVFLRAELDDKVGADETILTAGGTVLHVGPMSDGPVSATWRSVSLDGVPRRIFPAGVSRATVAAAMLDAADTGPHGRILVPLAR
ncbi:NAD(P)-dependent oxidoreductase [Streptomyces sp. NPDC090075]|uniref:NAD(P)-dependent oxidoreductase n=1 Tax=Streptomyces sp. NPDC090075 TaxID=3365937 RepID=UPI0037F801A3